MNPRSKFGKPVYNKAKKYKTPEHPRNQTGKIIP